MDERQARLHVTGIVTALRERGRTPLEVRIEPNIFGGVIVCVAFPVDNPLAAHGPVVECHLPNGWFAYEQVADELLRSARRCVVES
jgi:hypothetical protein